MNQWELNESLFSRVNKKESRDRLQSVECFSLSVVADLLIGIVIFPYSSRLLQKFYDWIEVVKYICEDLFD